MTGTAVAVVIAVVLGVLLIAAVVAGLRAGGATRSASQRAADAGDRLTASRRRVTELEAELFEVRRQLAGTPAPAPESHDASPPTTATEAPDKAPGASDGAISPPTPAADGGSVPEAAAADASIPNAPVAAGGSSLDTHGANAVIVESDQDRTVINAVWSLERLELEAQRELEAGLITAPVEVVAGVLVGALQREVERIREEMGTPGEMHSELPDEPDGRAGLLVLGAVRLTLGALARRCQAYDLRLEAGDGSVEATVVCEGFEPQSADETSAAIASIAAAVAAAGATAVFSPGPDGAAHAELSFPVG